MMALLWFTFKALIITIIIIILFKLSYEINVLDFCVL